MPVRSWLSVLSGVLWTTACLAAGDQSAARDRGSPARAPDPWADAREAMVARQIEARGVRSPAVLAAMRKVARHLFVPADLVRDAYDDTPLPIGFGQTISQPYIVAYMIESLHLEPQHRVLEVGTGSGYAAAILSQIVSHVYTIEWYPQLVQLAQKHFTLCGLTNITIKQGDGTLGWPEEAPFDAILVSAGGPKVPRPLLEQLVVGGRLVIPVGQEPGRQELLSVIRRDDTRFQHLNLGAVAFVPLRGVQGWGDEA